MPKQSPSLVDDSPRLTRVTREPGRRYLVVSFAVALRCPRLLPPLHNLEMNRLPFSSQRDERVLETAANNSAYEIGYTQFSITARKLHLLSLRSPLEPPLNPHLQALQTMPLPSAVSAPNIGYKNPPLRSRKYTTFTPFPRLPAEIRLKVWAFGLPDPHVVHVYYGGIDIDMSRWMILNGHRKIN